MASKKGIFLTIGILAIITIASFVFWFIPQNTQMTFVVSNFESHLDGVKNVHVAIKETLDVEFKNLLDGSITPQEYIENAEESSLQINSLIIQLVESKASTEWHESYINYIESLKQYNNYIRETIVVANMIENNEEFSKIEEILDKISQFTKNSESHMLKSDEARP